MRIQYSPLSRVMKRLPRVDLLSELKVSTQVRHDGIFQYRSVRLIQILLIRSCHLIRSTNFLVNNIVVYFSCFNCLFYVVIQIST